ncbi:sushi, von Willebrand factor type A, EGF and pentraxin domain-containing protein 1-like [Falco rusticolus]|uniref:sushi, von Willebrand factor type A, EGF and pentraxin domain-containing protein 1-like n=1 Tax=Falco rusticolus TaxID=120794 RepID=UPI00188692BF|nr:sushi, von Willebrand factor type A, EGF and pentraxin domain-containing protein 1-like [Falco rusticolus]
MTTGILKCPYSCTAPPPSVRTGIAINPKADDFDIKHGEKCPALPRTEFADVTADMYPVGTKLYYECDSGYARRSGQYMGIRCQSIGQVASWVYKEFECIANITFPTDEKILLSTAPMMELDFTQKPESKTQTPAPQKQENFSKFDQKDFCGPPKTVPHASISLNKQYYVGQVLNIKCQSGYDKRPPTSGTCTCKKVNGKISWTCLDIRCTNDSSEWLPQTVEPDLSVSLWFLVQSVSGSAHPSFSSSLILPVTAIFFALLIIPAVFV